MTARQGVAAPPTPSTGRPRDPGIDDAVLAATLQLLEDDGYSSLSISAVAERAGTTKPAIYRRWPVRQKLIVAALALRLDVQEPIDTGCTRCDLIGAIEMFTAAFHRGLPPRILAPLIADCAFEEELYRHAMDSLFMPLRNNTRAVLDRAQSRCDLRVGTDPELILDLLASMVHFRALFGHAPVTSALVEDLVDTLLRGIARDYESLRSMSESHGHGSPRPRASVDH